MIAIDEFEPMRIISYGSGVGLRVSNSVEMPTVPELAPPNSLINIDRVPLPGWVFSYRTAERCEFDQAVINPEGNKK
jgi:hypothetical protein